MTQGEGLINRCLGDLDRLFPADHALGKFSELGKAPVKIGTREDGRQAGLAKAFVQPLACEGLDVLPVVVDRLPIVAQGEVGEAQEEGRHHLEGKILAGHGNGERALAGLDGAVLVTRAAEVGAQIGGDPAQSAVDRPGTRRAFRLRTGGRTSPQMRRAQ